MKFTRNINTAKTNCKIEIRLDDECKNGHEDFAITATFWTPGKPRTDRNMEVAGCCHDEILKVCPEYSTFIRLHLHDFNGAPMSPVSNGMYHAFSGTYHSEKAGPASLAYYFNITLDKAETLCTAADAEHFQYLIERLNIPQAWKAEADKAIKMLEEMTGEKFTSKATRSHYTPMTDEQRADMEQKIKAGYYTPEAIKARNDETRKAVIQEQIKKYTEEFNNETEAAETRLLVNTEMSKEYPEKKGSWFYYHPNKSVTLSKPFRHDQVEEVETLLLTRVYQDIKVTFRN